MSFLSALAGGSMSPYGMRFVAKVDRTAPTIPLNVVATAGNKQISLSFSTPAFDGKSPILGYKYSIDNGVSYTTVNSTTSPIVISVAYNFTTYVVKLKAFNLIGDSLDVSSNATITFNVPSVPQNVIVTGGNKQLSIAFTALANNGGSVVTGYKYSLDGIQYTDVAGTTSPIVVTGLPDNTSYTVRLRAVSDVGDGAITTAASVTTYDVPSVPRNVIVTGGNKQISIAFTAPASNGGTVVTGYKYAFNDTDYTLVTGTTSPIVVTGLPDNTSYTVRLRAVSSIGDGAVVTSTPASTFAVPAAPQNFVVTSGNKQLSMTFSVSSDGGTAITGYKYSLNGASYITVNNTTAPFVITGLSDSTSYTVSLLLFNIIGDGPATTASAVSTYTVPSVPQNIIATGGNKQISIAFTAPANNGGSVVTGYKYSLNGAAYIVRAGTTSPIVVSNLLDSTSYTIKLLAYNTIGDGTESLEVSTTTYALASEPQDVVVTAGIRQLSVAFSAPASNGGATITGYKYSLDGANYTTVNSTTSPIVISSGISNNTSYTVRLRAFNTLGDGAIYTASSVTTPGVPSVPQSISSVAGYRQITVTYTAPSSNGGAEIIGYKYSLNNGTAVALSVAAATSPFVISNLVNSTAYVVRLWAVSSVGDGAVAIAGSVTTLSSTPVPNSPQNVVISPGYRQLSIAYTAPVNNGGAALIGYKYSLNSTVNYTSVLLTNATSPITIPNLLDNTSYVVRFLAYNSTGNSTAVVSSSVTTYSLPAAPANIVATGAYRQISLTFTPPAGQVDGYMYSLDGGVTYTTIIVGSSPITITGLTDGASYIPYLKAYNAVGQGAVGYANSVTTYNAPSAPTGLEVTPGISQLSLAFSPPFSDGGYPVLGYKYSLDGTSYVTVPGTVSPIVVTGLPNNTSYILKLLAYNIIGDGLIETAGASTTYRVPSGPQNVVVTSGNKQISIAFTAPLVSGERAVTGYKYSLDGIQYTEVAGTTSPIVVTGLAADTSYTVRLRAVSDVGDGDITTASPVYTYFTSSAPQNVVVTGGNKQISIAFTAPANNGDLPITSYKYSLDGIQYTEVAGTTSPIVVTGLVDNTSYTVRLRAVSDVGDGAITTASSVSTYTTPSVPRNVVITAYNRQLSVAFNEPSSNGGLAITGYKYSLDGGAYITVNSTTSPITISSLVKDQSYVVRVRAFSEMGDGSVYVAAPIAPIGGIEGYYSTGYYYDGALTSGGGGIHAAVKGDGRYYYYDNTSGVATLQTGFAIWNDGVRPVYYYFGAEGPSSAAGTSNPLKITGIGFVDIGFGNRCYDFTASGTANPTYLIAGAYSVGYLTGVGTIDDTYMALTPVTVLDNSKYYTFSAGQASEANGAYSNGYFELGVRNADYNSNVPTVLKDTGDTRIFANGMPIGVSGYFSTGYYYNDARAPLPAEDSPYAPHLALDNNGWYFYNTDGNITGSVPYYLYPVYSTMASYDYSTDSPRTPDDPQWNGAQQYYTYLHGVASLATGYYVSGYYGADGRIADGYGIHQTKDTSNCYYNYNGQYTAPQQVSGVIQWTDGYYYQFSAGYNYCEPPYLAQGYCPFGPNLLIHDFGTGTKNPTLVTGYHKQDIWYDYGSGVNTLTPITGVIIFTGGWWYDFGSGIADPVIKTGLGVPRDTTSVWDFGAGVNSNTANPNFSPSGWYFFAGGMRLFNGPTDTSNLPPIQSGLVEYNGTYYWIAETSMTSANGPYLFENKWTLFSTGSYVGVLNGAYGDYVYYGNMDRGPADGVHSDGTLWFNGFKIADSTSLITVTEPNSGCTGDIRMYSLQSGVGVRIWSVGSDCLGSTGWLCTSFVYEGVYYTMSSGVIIGSIVQ